MLNPSGFHDLVSGRRRGVVAALARGALRVAETGYRAAVGCRNHRYDTRRASIHHVGVPVVSVGNLTLGGTGKTPMVKWLAQRFLARGMRVAIVSRGYRAGESGRNDEALELEMSLPGVPHLQNPDRVAAAQRAIDEFQSQVILLDDGFQHRRLARDLDIVLLDALAPFGFDHVFPRGTLREPVASLKRAEVIALSRADLIDEAQRETIRRRVERHAAGALWIETSHVPRRLLSAGGAEQPLEALAARRVAAFCGIGNPNGFRGTLGAAGYDVADVRTFPDHHAYRRQDIESLARWAESIRADALICTNKDLVKINREQLGSTPLWALMIELEVIRDAAALDAKLADSFAMPTRG